MRQRHAATFLLPLLYLSLATGPSPARVWRVTPEGDGDAPTIQAAADSSAQDDTVLVAAGTYFENIYLEGKGITLMSESGAESTILDGSSEDGPVVYFDDVVGGEVEGFTIQNGTTGGDRGIVSIGMDLAIRSNIIRRNYTISAGAGVQVAGRCVIEGNLITENAAEQGGGVYVTTYADLTAVVVIDNVFSNNTAYFRGGGLYVIGNPDDQATVRGNLFISNQALTGSAIYAATVNPIDSNTLYGNKGPGGAITFTVGAEPDVRWNIIAGTIEGPAVYCEYNSGYSAWPRFRCNAFWDNEGGLAGGLGCDVYGVLGNFVEDPLLCDPEFGDFHLTSQSPCLPGNHPNGFDCGLIGAFDVGCTGPDPVEKTSWGRIKVRFR